MLYQYYSIERKCGEMGSHLGILQKRNLNLFLREGTDLSLRRQVNPGGLGFRVYVLTSFGPTAISTYPSENRWHTPCPLETVYLS